MPYRRPVHNTKKYLPPYGGGNAPNTFEFGYGKDTVSIPMPNVSEGFPGILGKLRIPGLPAVANFLKEHIKLEELILIGLIILLLDESIEDDFLLIMLIYILLF
jgi:hypothetical protein